jgi:hypothetical protein
MFGIHSILEFDFRLIYLTIFLHILAHMLKILFLSNQI